MSSISRWQHLIGLPTYILNKRGSEYFYLSNTYLSIRAKIVQGNGGAITAAANCAPVKYWIHSLFSQLNVHFNAVLVTPSKNTYLYKAYMETLLTYDAGAKQCQLMAGMFHKDMANQMNTFENEGMTKRQNRAANSVELDMVGRVH